MLNGLGLFEGIGGISLGLKEWVRPVAYCEIDDYAKLVLTSRFSSAQLPKAPIFPDVRILKGCDLPPVDIIFGGFPCQDISNAGLRAGLGGERSKLFFEIVRLACEIRPAFLFLENVSAITTRGLNRVCLELSSIGYDSRWTIVSAAEIGACHIRKRWFLLAHSNRMRLREKCRQKHKRNKACKGSLQLDRSCVPRRFTWPSERRVKPRVARTGDGVSYRVDRARCLGNAVLPAQAKEAFIRLSGLNHVP